MTEPAGPTRAALYARISRPDEQGILANQLQDLRELAARKRHVVTREYVEVAPGDDRRQGLAALLHDAALERGRPFDLVLFRSLSRMTRTGTLSALEILRKLEAAGVGWRFLDTPILDSAEDTSPLVRNVLLAVIAEIDRDYRDRISKATRAAFQRRKNLAEAAGEKLAWGRGNRRKQKGPPEPNPEPKATTEPPEKGTFSEP